MADHDPEQSRAARNFLRLRHALWRLLPAPLRRVVPATFVGYCVLNGFTFGLDLVLLTVGYRVLHLPNWLAVTLAYGTALTLAYLLNRWFNFRSHGAVGRQSARYLAVVVVNYTAFILGLGSGLTYLGVQFQLSRIIAGVGEAIWMYSAMRWIVFRDTLPNRPAPAPDEPADDAHATHENPEKSQPLP